MNWGGPSFSGHAVPGIRGFLKMDALLRFAAKCEFDPMTGCVLWTGSKSWGRGKSIRYGSFKYEGKTWLAHRWSAKFIHGLDIDGFQVDHYCPLDRAGIEPLLPNHLCVEHVQPLSDEKNRHLQTERRRHYVEVLVGLRAYDEIYGPEPENPLDALPFYIEPDWLRNARLAA